MLTTFSWAQTTVALVSSDSPFQLRGAVITPGQGVPSWPVLTGDVVKAGEKPVTLNFLDGSNIFLSAGSSGRLEMQGATVVFRLLAGCAHHALSAINAIKLATGDTDMTPSKTVGDLRLGGNCPVTAGWWTAGHTTAVLGAAAGATALGVGLARRKPSCSGNDQGNQNCQGNQQ